MTTLGITSVKDHGAVGDGSTDDTSAITAAIAAISTRGVLYFPPGTYKTTGGFSISVPMVIMGAGGGGGETLDYDAGGGTVGHVSQITCTSQTAVLFDVSASGVQFHDLSLKNTFAGTPSAGSAIKTSSGGGDHGQYTGLTIQGFYKNMDLAYGREYMIARCYCLDPVNIGFDLRNTPADDVLEISVIQCQFMENLYSADAMLQLTRGGGVRIQGNLFFALGPSDATSPVTCIKINLAHATSNMMILGNHFENWTDTAIYKTGSTINTLHIADNEFNGGRSTNVADIVVIDAADVMIHDNVHIGNGQNQIPVELTTVTGGRIHDNRWRSFHASVTDYFSGGTSIVEHDN